MFQVNAATTHFSSFTAAGFDKVTYKKTIPPIHYKSTIDIDHVECVMKKSLSHAVTGADCNMI